MKMSTFLYHQLTDVLAQQIAEGAFRPGDRLPSIRSLARQRGLSLATVIAAYQMLEDRGLVSPRPRSGYFVRAQPKGPALRPSTPSPQPRRPSMGDLILDVLRAVRDPQILSLGAAYPSSELLPTEALARHLAASARSHNLAANALHPWGYDPLRRQIAQRALFAGSRLDPDEVLVTHGATEALNLALRAVARPGDAIAVESPTYFGFLQLIEELGLRALEIATDPTTGLRPDALRKVMENQRLAAVVVVPHFQNPLGARMPEERARELVTLCAEHEVPLLEDDLFRDLAFDGRHPTSLRAYDQEGGVLCIGSFSKTIAPGFRLGWIAPGRYAESVRRTKAALAPATSMPVQMALARYLGRGGFQNHLRGLRHTFSETLAKMRQKVAESFPEGTRLSDPRGGFLLWIELPQGDAVKLHHLALRDGISIAPGPIFSASGRFRRCLRLNAGHPWSPEIENALDRLAHLARQI